MSFPELAGISPERVPKSHFRGEMKLICLAEGWGFRSGPGVFLKAGGGHIKAGNKSVSSRVWGPGENEAAEVQFAIGGFSGGSRPAGSEWHLSGLRCHECYLSDTPLLCAMDVVSRSHTTSMETTVRRGRPTKCHDVF